MSLKVQDLCAFMEKYAPTKLCMEYDNVGLMIGDPQNEITSILVTLDCTLEVIDEAINRKCNFILAHHPLLFRKPSSITTGTLLGKKIIKLIKNDINVYCSHTNLDSVYGGINDYITKILGFDKWKVIEPSFNNNIKDEKSGIGRLVTLTNSLKLSELCELIKEKLQVPYLRIAGDENKEIRNIAIINGSGTDYIDESIKNGADCIITGDTTYHYVSDYSEMGIAIIDAGHFATEWPALVKIGQLLGNKIEELGYHNLVLISNVIKDPYKTK